MQIKIVAIAFLFALLSATAAHAQCANTYPKFSLEAQITSDFPTQFTGYVTPAILSGFLNNAVVSWQQNATANAQVGTTYAIQGDTTGASDSGKVITFSNANPIAVSLAAASSAGFCPFSVYLKNNSAATSVTVTPASGTINGLSTLTLGVSQGAFLISDGTNWQVLFTGGGSGAGNTPGGSNGQFQFNSGGTFGGTTGVTTTGINLQVASGDLVLQGSGSGSTILNASATASGVLTLPATTDTVTTNSFAQTLVSKTLTSPTINGGTLSGTFGGTATFSGTTNFTGSFQIGGSTQTFPGSGNIVGTGDTQTLTNKSIAGSEINSGTVAATYLPTATAAAKGVVQTDGSTITNTAGVINCTTGTTSQLGCLEPDGSTITVSNGIITSTAAGSAAAVTIGTTTITSGTAGKVLYQNGASPSGTIGEYSITGTGNVVMSASPTLSGTVGGNLTFSGNTVFGGTLTAASLATPGTIAGTICASASGAIFYFAGNNCFGGTITAGAGGLVPTSGSPSTLYAEQMPLGGRVTLVSGTCVATTDQAAQTTVYYAPCGGGKYIPIYDGSNMELHQFTSSDTDQVGLTLTLGSNWAANTLFDLYITINSGTVTPCTVAWSNSTAGSSTRATAVTQFKGVWVNSASIAACRTTNSATIAVGQYQGTLVGTFLTNGSTGTIDLKFGTAASDGGTACICIWNVYNQVQASSFVGDTTASWDYTTATFRQANGQAGNQINVVQGLASGLPIDVQVFNSVLHSGSAVIAVSGIGIDSTSSDSSTANEVPSNQATTSYNPSVAWYTGVLAAGYHNIVRLEYSTATGTTEWQGYSSPGDLTGIKGKIWY